LKDEDGVGVDGDEIDGKPEQSNSSMAESISGGDGMELQEPVESTESLLIW